MEIQASDVKVSRVSVQTDPLSGRLELHAEWRVRLLFHRILYLR